MAGTVKARVTFHPFQHLLASSVKWFTVANILITACTSVHLLLVSPSTLTMLILGVQVVDVTQYIQ